MSHHKRVSRKKSAVPQHKRNVNPKLNAFQREQKRSRLANQPPVELANQRDYSASARKQFEFINAARDRRLAYRARINGDAAAAAAAAAPAGKDTSASSLDVNHQRAILRQHQKHSREDKSLSLNAMLAPADDPDSLSTRTRLGVLEKKAKLRIKKKLRRRGKREEITQRKLQTLMGHDAAETKLQNNTKLKGKERAAAERALARQEEDALKAVAGPLTRKEKKQLQQDQLRKKAAEQRRKSNKDNGSDLEEETLDDDRKIGHQQQQQQQQNLRRGADKDPDDDETEMPDGIVSASAAATAAANGGDDDAEDGKKKGGKKGKKRNPEAEQEEWAAAEQRRHRQQQQREKGKLKDFMDADHFDFVRFGDRVDAPPVLDVVPSAALGAALDRRTSKMRGGAGNVDADAASGGGGRRGSRVADLSGHSSLSEAAHKILRSTGAPSVIAATMAARARDEKSKAASTDPFTRSVSGATLQSSADFEAMRQRVLENYSRKHPVSFGKQRTYSPLQ